MSISTLPSMEFTFSIDVKGSDTGKQFQGTFTYKRPDRRAKSDISRLAARLNEDLKNLEEDAKFMHEVLASLRFTLKESPDWWKSEDFGMKLYDDNVSIEIYKACLKFENEWTDKVWGNQDKAKEELKEALKTKEDLK